MGETVRHVWDDDTFMIPERRMYRLEFFMPVKRACVLLYIMNFQNVVATF